MYQNFGKRLVDLLLTIPLFVILLPIYAIIALVVRIRLGSPVFFSQERIGKDQKPFVIHKFRTMTEERDADGRYLPDEQRITRWGRLLRATSLDELPELINIIKGDMSIIGPRPLPAGYMTAYSEYETKRFDVRGGLIPPEVLYDNTMPTWDEQLKYEADYAVNLSFSSDVRIFISVFKGLASRKQSDYGDYVRKSLIEERTSNQEVYK